MSSIIEKARAGALAGELRGGQSHTVEVVVFIVFAAVIGAFLLSGGAAGGNVFFEMMRIWSDAIDSIRQLMQAGTQP